MGRGSNTVWSTHFADNGRLALLGDANGLIEVCDAVSGKSIRRLSADAGRVWSLRDESWGLQLNVEVARTWAVALAPAGSHLAASAGDGRTRVWAVPSGDLLWERDARAGRVRSLAFDHSGYVDE